MTSDIVDIAARIMAEPGDRQYPVRNGLDNHWMLSGRTPPDTMERISQRERDAGKAENIRLRNDQRLQNVHRVEIRVSYPEHTTKTSPKIFPKYSLASPDRLVFSPVVISFPPKHIFVSPFPALRTGHGIFQRPSPGKQFSCRQPIQSHVNPRTKDSRAHRLARCERAIQG